MTVDPATVERPRGGPGDAWAARLSAPEGVLLVDLSGHVIDVNAAACRILGRAEPQLRAPDWWFQLDARTASGVSLVGHTSFGRRVIATGTSLREQIVDVAQPDGMRMWLSVDYEPLLSTDDTIGGLALSIRRAA